MSSLRFIKRVTDASVGSVDVTNVFSEEFDVYKVIMSHEGSYNNTGNLRFINAAGSVVSDSNYDWAYVNGYTHTTFAESKLTNQPEIVSAFGNWVQGGSTTYIFNPYNDERYKYILCQGVGYSSTTTQPMQKCIGSYADTTRMTGFQVIRSGGNFGTVGVSVYGVRLDL